MIKKGSILPAIFDCGRKSCHNHSRNLILLRVVIDMARYCEICSGKDWRNCAFSFLRIHIRNLSNEHDHGALSAKLCSIPSYENPRSESLTTEERKTDIYGPTCMISWICYTQLLYKKILHPKISLTVQHCNSHIL